MLQDHSVRMKRALRSLAGLSVGDAFGETFFYPGETHRIEHRLTMKPPWLYTDDTEMAIAIVEVLREVGEINTDLLAHHFAKRYRANPNRGYGATAHSILRSIDAGMNYREVSPKVFDGQGSLGNGAAMRVGPVGAYFADNSPEIIVRQAVLSAEVTHANPEGIAGAVAVALAAAWASNHQGKIDDGSQQAILEYVAEHTPGSMVRESIVRMRGFSPSCSVMMAAAVLGNGSKVSAPDTVPFALWCASHHLNEFQEGLWTTVSALGDRDTTCAIFGSIVAMSCPEIPANWLTAREPLPIDGVEA